MIARENVSKNVLLSIRTLRRHAQCGWKDLRQMMGGDVLGYRGR